MATCGKRARSPDPYAGPALRHGVSAEERIRSPGSPEEPPTARLREEEPAAPWSSGGTGADPVSTAAAADLCNMFTAAAAAMGSNGTPRRESPASTSPPVESITSPPLTTSPPLPKPSLPKSVTNSRASTPAAGDSVAVELNLATRAWHFYPKGAQVRWRREPQPVHAGVLQSIPEQTKRRRRTGDVKDGEHKAEALIRLPNWRVTRSTPLEDLEVLLAALIRCLGHWSGDLNGVAWCVGGSVAATLASRDAAGDTAVLRFCLCNSSGGCWVGDGQSKIGATCKFHCDGIDVDGVTIDGRFHESIKLSKCTWMKCCYGKKPFGSPPEVPWCRQCECQKNLDRRFAPGPASTPWSSCP